MPLHDVSRPEPQPFYPGFEIGYDQAVGGAVNVVGTVQATPTTILTAAAHTFDGAPVIAEFYCPKVTLPSVAASTFGIGIYESGTIVQWLGQLVNNAAANLSLPVTMRVKFTPSAGSHTYTIGAWVSVTTGTPNVFGSTGGSSLVPYYIRFTKV